MEKKKKIKYYFVVAVICWIICLTSFLVLGLLPVMFGLATIVITILALIIDKLLRDNNNLFDELEKLLDESKDPR